MGNVIQTEFTTLDTMLRRVREANPAEIVMVYEIETEENTRTRVTYVGASRTMLVGMLFGVAQDIWNEPEKTVQTVGPGGGR